MNKITLLGTFFLISLSLFSQTGPGGVGNATSNQMWLSGDFGTFTDNGSTPANSDGNRVQQWNDRSGNNRNALQNTLNNRPIFEDNAANGKPGLRFTGNLFIDGPAQGIANTSSYTYLIAFKDTLTGPGGTTNGDGHFILDRPTATQGLVSLKPVTGSNYFYQKRNNAGTGLGGVRTTTAINTNTKLIQLRRDNNTDYQIFYNNSLEGTLADSDGATTPPRPRLGRHATNANGGLRGYINEFITYNFALNQVQTIIVNNYLAAKYGISLDANDLYTMDDAAFGNYDHEVAGVGRINGSITHEDAQGSGIIRILNPRNLGNNEYLFWGHDNESLDFNNFTDLPDSNNFVRLRRTWRVSEVDPTNNPVDVGGIDLRIEVSSLGSFPPSALRLLVDTDNDGSFDDETLVSGATDLGGGFYQFPNVISISNQSRYTFAIEQTSLDSDGDGVVNVDDLDDDNDGILDVDEQINIATSGTAFQSSTDFDGVASRGIDGNTDGNYNNNSITHTANTTPTEYWEVDLGTTYNISDIIFHNRTNCCPDRISKVYVLVSDTPFPSNVIDLQGSLDNADFVFQFADGESAAQVTIPVNLSGRYVRLQKSGDNISGYLSIAELQVFATDADFDGIPNRLDLDSDGDGCSDANEYYALATADGGDDGVYGTGVPTADSDGLVVSAGYDGVNYSDAIDANINEGCSFIQTADGNWNTATNWREQAVPSLSNDAIIRANSTVSQNQAVNDLIIDSGFTVIVDSGQTLSVSGNLTNNAEVTGAGEVILNGSSAQSLSGTGAFENLRIANPTSVDFTEASDLFGVLYVDQGILNTNGNLSLRCDFGIPPKTAQVGPVNGAIIGNVTVEQCYPARRAFRFISSSVTTSTSIRANWQGNPVDYLDATPLGYGTHITGVSNGAANATLAQDGNNGFDYNPSGNSSMFTFDNTAGSWNAIVNTVQTLNTGDPYRLMIRGDRSIDITSNATPPTDTRLRATGALTIGNTTQSVLSSIGGDFNFIGNPYQAQVNMNSVLSGSTNLSTTEYYVWDPTLGGTPTPGQPGGRGAYVTVDLATGTNSLGSEANQYLQPMQAAFVKTDLDGASSIAFSESVKEVSPVQTLTKSLSQVEYINIQLFDTNSFSQRETPSDGLRIKFDNSYSLTSKDDSPKLGNLDENLARVEDNYYSAIERRPFPEANEKLDLFINQYRREAYIMKFDMTDNLNTKVFIEDKYLNQVTEITQTDTTYSFSIDNSIPESKASDRFSIVFEPISLSTPDESLASLSLYPNPTQGNFKISGLNLGQDAEVEIYNMIGQQVYKRNYDGQSNIEVTDFNANTGIYLVKVKTNQGERTFKLIKE